jgi:rhodanese-related sulfurtransferase
MVKSAKIRVYPRLKLRIPCLIASILLGALLFSQKPGDFDKKVHGLLNHTVPLIDVHELWKRLQGETPPLVLDTREEEEFEVSHIEQARHVGYKTFDPRSLGGVPTDRPIVVYCSLGVRSEEVGEKLRKAGFIDVVNLFGGIFEWVHHDYPVVDMDNRPTRRVHAFSKKWGRWLFKGEKVY